LPGVHVSLPALTKKDIADVTLGAQLGVDFVALSFVRKPSDLAELRDLLIRKKSNAQVLAKIEDQAAVESIDDIIKIADLVMVARGDLGIEVPMEELPIIQRRIVKSCIRLGKPVVVATHLLESMIKNRVPTRAEITDVANAVFEQADAIMLSGETSIGQYPVDCVEVLNRVAARNERSGGAGYAESAILEDARQKTVASAVVLANSLARSKIIVFTRHGRMARNTSNLRPERAIIFAFTPSEEVRQQLSICWGVYPIQIEFSDDPNVTIETAQKYLRDQKLTTSGDNLVVISDVRARDALVDCVQLRTAK
jgi:pyruvate kinase